ncbi:hypothetical protein ACLM5H_17625 [Fredinandcohnia humi]
MKLTHVLLVPLLLFSLQNTVSAQQTQEQSYGPFTIVQKEYVDLDGDGQKEILELYARKNQSQLANEWALKIDGQEVGTYHNKQDLYQQAEMEFADILQNGKQDIMIYFRSVGSGGITGLTVLSHTEKKIETIFADPNSIDMHKKSTQRFDIKYKGDYEVTFTDKQTDLVATIPLSEQRYRDFPDKNELQKRLQSITAWVDPISDYHFEKLTKMKPQDIVTVQKISGIAHYDVIAHYLTRYVFDKQEQKYLPTEVSLYTTETRKKIAEKTFR